MYFRKEITLVEYIQDIQQEQERMKHVVRVIINEAELLENEYDMKLIRQKQLLKESVNIKINNSSSEAMWESSGELRNFEQDLAIKSNELNQVQKRRAVLEKMQEEPYFGRIDYHEVSENEDEQIYIGIGSLFAEGENLVVDWRAPIASLYYEGNVGDSVRLKFGEAFETFKVDLKRQFRVKDGKIVGMIDTDNVMGDPYLLEVLESGSSHQMGAVVATLQKEQNQIIRETTFRNVLIQGVAGSGKTVVMMQKIAYLIYTFKNTLKPDEILLFSPNRIFQEYISQVLPSLGEWDVVGNTFSQFIQSRMPTVDFQPIEVGEHSHFTALKGSLDFYKALTRYGKTLKKKYLRFSDIMFREEVLISKEEIQAMYAEIESRGSLAAKLDILNALLLQKVEELKFEALGQDWVEEVIQNLSTDAIHQFESLSHTIVNIEGEMRKEIVEEAFEPIEKRVMNQGYFQYRNQYLHFLRSVPQLVDLEKFDLTKEEWQSHIQKMAEKLRENKLATEDLTAFYALLLQMKGIMKQKSYQYICMDEVQDFTPFQLQLLHDLYPRAHYIMAGDLNQNIWQNRLEFDDLQMIFDEEIDRQQLWTSYRSTKEIMDFADEFASLTNGKANPIRSRNKPEVLIRKEENFMEQLQERIKMSLERQERIAFLAPTIKAAENFTTILNQLEVDYKKVFTENDTLNHAVILMPIGLAKGLEFDTVFALGLEENHSEQSTSASKQVWYTIFSRAMHQLYVLLEDEDSILLEGVSEDTYDIVK